MGETTRPLPFLAPLYTVSTMSIISCLSSIVQLILLLLPVPKSIMMCLVLQSNRGTNCMSRHDVYSYMVHFNQPTFRLSLAASHSPEEEHDCTRIVQLVHLVKIWHLCDVDQVYDGKVFHLKRDTTKGTFSSSSLKEKRRDFSTWTLFFDLCVQLFTRDKNERNRSSFQLEH